MIQMTDNNKKKSQRSLFGSLLSGQSVGIFIASKTGSNSIQPKTCQIYNTSISCNLKSTMQIYVNIICIKLFMLQTFWLYYLTKIIKFINGRMCVV